MSKAVEFKRQWDKFLTIVEADLQKDIAARRQPDYTVATMIVQRELAKWSISSHYNGAWLREFKEQYPGLGERFEVTLKQIRIEPIPYTPTSTVPYISMVVGVPAITLPALRWAFSASLGWQVAGSLAGMLVTAPIARNLWNNQFQRALSAYMLQVHDSLNIYGQRLQKIVAEADQEVS